MRFMRVRPTARGQFFLDIASPSLASPPFCLRHKTVKYLSRLRLALLNTRLYAFSSSRREARRKRWQLVLAVVRVLLVVAGTRSARV